MASEREITEKEEMLEGFLNCMTAMGKVIAKANERYTTGQDDLGNELCEWDKYWAQRNALLKIADLINGDLFQQVDYAIDELADEVFYSTERAANNGTLVRRDTFVEEVMANLKEFRVKYSSAQEEIQVRDFMSHVRSRVDKIGGEE